MYISSSNFFVSNVALFLCLLLHCKFHHCIRTPARIRGLLHSTMIISCWVLQWLHLSWSHILLCWKLGTQHQSWEKMQWYICMHVCMHVEARGQTQGFVLQDAGYLKARYCVWHFWGRGGVCHSTHVVVRRQLRRSQFSSFPFPWVLGPELRLPGLGGKHVYPVGLLTSPTLVFSYWPGIQQAG